MPLLLRFFAMAGLWIFGKSRKPSVESERIGKLSWPAKVQLSWRLVRDKRVSRLARGTAFLPVIYLVSPIDLVPDFIPIIGRLDDALMFGLVVDLLIKSVPSAVLREHLDRVAPMKAA
jgi:uncharacterized membrane protein YkvA (DUF1232 family)